MPSPKAQVMPHVVIVGAGFGGLSAAQILGPAPVYVTVIDRTNHHLFQPLLYQVAMAGLSPAQIAWPVRSVMRQYERAKVLMADVTSVNLAGQTLSLADGTELTYDYLILATGGRTSYFGHDEWEKLAPGLKVLEDAVEIRRRVLTAFEAAEKEPDEARRRRFLTFVVVGGGPTGVELAGALAELSRTVLARDFRTVDPTLARVLLLEGGSRLLPSFPERLSAKAAEQLFDLGADIRLNAKVTNIDEQGVHLGEELIAAGTVIWGAGVQATELTKTLDAPLDRLGRVLVEPDLTIPNYRTAFVIGDTAAFTHQTGEPLPGVSPVAMQMGRTAARNILRAVQGQAYETFHYVDKGTMATIGRSAAIAHLGRLQLSGWLAWLTWLVVHIFFLIGFRNRFTVLFDWAWSYLTYQRGARLITSYHWQPSIKRPPAESAPRASDEQKTKQPV